ncbi:hypothetical protein PV392_24640 [Streptomyces sp. ME03-5709C]|nr:hypothetical protein [Streptomyces sp. ME03-5709C]
MLFPHADAVSRGGLVEERRPARWWTRMTRRWTHGRRADEGEGVPGEHGPVGGVRADRQRHGCGEAADAEADVDHGALERLVPLTGPHTFGARYIDPEPFMRLTKPSHPATLLCGNVVA